MKGLLTLVVLGAFGIAMAGCHASGDVGDNDTSHTTRTTTSSDGSYSKKTTETTNPNGSYSRTETRTNTNP